MIAKVYCVAECKLLLPSQLGKKSYKVSSLAFSPDSTRIAVGQTDNIVFVYRIGDEWYGSVCVCVCVYRGLMVTLSLRYSAC